MADSRTDIEYVYTEIDQFFSRTNIHRENTSCKTNHLIDILFKKNR